MDQVQKLRKDGSRRSNSLPGAYRNVRGSISRRDSLQSQGSQGFIQRRVSTYTANALEPTADADNELHEFSSRDQIVISRTRDKVEDLLQKITGDVGETEGAEDEEVTKDSLCADVLKSVEVMAEELRESFVKTSSTGKRLQAARDELRKQHEYCNALKRKTMESQEVLRKNDVQMDFLRAQLTRREKMLHDQRQAFFKELMVLREQATRRLSGQNAGELMEFWDWQMQSTTTAGAASDGISPEEIQKKLRALQQQNQKKLEELEKKRILEVKQLTETYERDLQNTRDELNQRVKQFRDLEERTKEQIAQMEEDHISQVTSLKERHDCEVTDLKQRLIDQERELRREALDEKEKLRGEMQATIDDLESQNRETSKKLISLQERMEEEIFEIRQSYEKQLLERDERIRADRESADAALEEATSALKQKLVERDFEMDKLRKEVTELQQSVNSRSTREAELELELEQAKKEIESLEVDNKAKDREIADLKKELESLKSQLEAALTRPKSAGPRAPEEMKVKEQLRVNLAHEKELKQEIARTNWTRMRIGQKEKALRTEVETAQPAKRDVVARMLQRWEERRKVLEAKRKQMELERRRNLELILDAARLLSDPTPAYSGGTRTSPIPGVPSLPMKHVQMMTFPHSPAALDSSRFDSGRAHTAYSSPEKSPRSRSAAIGSARATRATSSRRKKRSKASQEVLSQVLDEVGVSRRGERGMKVKISGSGVDSHGYVEYVADEHAAAGHTGSPMVPHPPVGSPSKSAVGSLNRSWATGRTPGSRSNQVSPQRRRMGAPEFSRPKTEGGLSHSMPVSARAPQKQSLSSTTVARGQQTARGHGAEWTLDFSSLNASQRREVVLDMIYRDRARLEQQRRRKQTYNAYASPASMTPR